MNIMRSSELMGTLLGTALFCKSTLLQLILSIVNSVGHLPIHGTERCRALDALADRLDRTTFRVAEGKDLRDTGQVVGEVEVVSGEDELAEEDRSDVTTMMR